MCAVDEMELDAGKQHFWIANAAITTFHPTAQILSHSDLLFYVTLIVPYFITLLNAISRASWRWRRGTET